MVQRLDLAALLPNVKPWPPVFAGEPPPRDAEAIMASTLHWHDLHAVNAWARQLACYTSGLHGHPPQTVERLAILGLRRVIDAAARGLMSKLCTTQEERDAAAKPSAPPRAPRQRRPKKGGAR